MSEISSLYNSRNTLYKTKSKRSGKFQNGDVKHIVYREGRPILTEIIKVHRDEEQAEQNQSSNPRSIRTAEREPRERRSTSEVLDKKRKKLSERLKNAVRNSQTLWSEKEGIWISYQGKQGFLVKLFDASNRVVSSEVMTQSQLLDSSIPGLFDAGWKII